MRTPVYTKDGKARIISMPGGQWACQQMDGSRGSRERDPWRNTHNVTTKEEALQQLSTFGKIDE